MNFVLRQALTRFLNIANLKYFNDNLATYSNVSHFPSRTLLVEISGGTQVYHNVPNVFHFKPLYSHQMIISSSSSFYLLFLCLCSSNHSFQG